MEIPGIAPTKDQVALLKRVLASPEQPEETLTYQELRGFLFAIAIAPILVKPSEWIPDVFGGEGPALRNLKEAQTVMAAVMACYNDAVRASHIEGTIDPREVGLDVDSTASLTDWSQGFVAGYTRVEEAWGALLEARDDEDRARLDTAIVALTIWSDPLDYQQLTGVSDAELEEELASCQEMVPAALGLLARTGRGVHEETVSGRRAGPEPRPQRRAVGRNDRCPCGSGRKYKNCCLRVH